MTKEEISDDEFNDDESLITHGIEEEIKILKILAKEEKKPLMIYIWTDNMAFIDYDDIHIIEKDDKKWVRLIRNNDMSLSSTMVSLDKIQAVKIEIAKTDEYTFLKQLVDSGLISAQQQQTTESSPITEQSRQSYT